MTEPTQHAAYRTIFKSTTIVGGAQAANIAIGIVRMKALALMLGPSGVGLAGMYQTATGLIGTVAGLGIGSAGVRQIAEAAGSGDETRIARTILTLRRTARISGALGMLAVLVLATQLSRATFGSDAYVWGFALMSLTLLFNGITVGQTALLQGLRRLKDLAACNVLGAAFGTVASITLVYFLGERGVAPFLVAVSGFGVLTSWWFARRVRVEAVELPWGQVWAEARPLLTMGGAFVVSGLLAAGVAWLTRIIVARQLGLDAVGLYTAALTLSSVYVGVVLGAMGADFYPRLTAVARDNEAVNRLVNQQTEMGLLIALPGILTTLVLAPWVLKILYSAEFVPATEVIRWLVLGVGLRVVGWPLGFVQLAKGRARLFMATEAVFSALHVGLFYAGVHWLGLVGSGVAFAALYLVYALGMAFVCRWLSGFSWSRQALVTLGLSGILAAVVMATLAWPANPAAQWGGAAIALVGSVGSLIALKAKLDVSVADSIKFLRHRPRG